MDDDQQKLDDEAKQLQALGILDRIRERCGEEVAEEAAYQMGLGTFWNRHREAA